MPASNRFFASFFLILSAQCFWLPSLSLDPQPFAEAATHFFRLARDVSWIENLLAVDAGSLSWPNRLFALLYARVLGLEAGYPAAIQWTFNLFIAAAASWINRDAYRAFIPDDALRFAAGLFVGAGFLSAYDSFSMVNAGYFGFLPLLLTLLEDKQGWSRARLAATALAGGLLATSKAYYLALAPIAAFRLWGAWRAGRRKEAVFQATLAAFLAFQALALLAYLRRGEGAGVALQAPPFLELLGKGALHLASLFWSFLPARPAPLIGVALAAAGTGGLLFLLRKDPPARALGLACLFSAAFCMLLVLRQMPMPAFEGQGLDWPYQDRSRGWFIPRVMLFTFLILGLSRIAPPLPRRLALGAWCLLLLFKFPHVKHEATFDGEPAAFAWKDMLPLLKRDAYYLPVNPPPMGLAKGMELLRKDKVWVGAAGLDLEPILWSLPGRPAPTLSALIAKAPAQGQGFAGLKACVGGDCAKPMGPADGRYQYLLFDRPLRGRTLKFIGPQPEALHLIGSHPNREMVLGTPTAFESPVEVISGVDLRLAKPLAQGHPSLELRVGRVWLRAQPQFRDTKGFYRYRFKVQDGVLGQALRVGALGPDGKALTIQDLRLRALR